MPRKPKPTDLPPTLYMNLPSYAMTGTDKGATEPQIATMGALMVEQGLLNVDGFFWHFGDCVGADQQAFEWVSEFFMFIAVTVAHPGLNLTGKRAFCKADEIREPMEELGRNARMAYLGHNGLFGLPATKNEILRAGDWATIRTAGKLKRPTWIINPEGEYIYYPEGYATELRRDMVDRDDLGHWGI